MGECQSTKLGKYQLAGRCFNKHNEFKRLLKQLSVISFLSKFMQNIWPSPIKTPVVNDQENKRFATLFETKVQDSAEAFYDKLYGPVGLQLQKSRSLDMAIQGFDFAGLHVASIRHGVTTSATVYEQHPFWVFSYLSSGSVQNIDNGKIYAMNDCVIRRPGDAYRIKTSADMEIINLRVSQSDIDMACVALFGNSFAQTIKLDVSDSAHALPASTLARVIRNLSSTPYYQHQFADRLERKVKESALFELLLACPNSISPNFDKSEALPASIRRAIDYIHANLENFPTVVDIATAACISVRAVTKGFNKHLGTSPLQYMLDQRLEGARRQLSKGASDQKVTDVALQWGFLHLGQFSIRYKKQFGESPRETLSKAKL